MGVRRWVAAAVALPVLAFPVVTVSAQPDDDHGNVHATLVRIDVFHAAKGKPQPAVANCSDDTGTPQSNDEWALTGWQSEGGTARLNTSTVPSGLGDARDDLQSAFNAWSQGAGAPGFSVVNTGTVTRQTANRGTDLLFARVSGNAIAVTYTWRWSDGLYESDVVFNKALPWAILTDDGTGCLEDRPVYDLENIAAHEFGHVHGLDHPSTGRFQTMYSYGYTGETLKRSPAEGDRAGIAANY
jgi:hypothetical protein